MTTAIVMMSTIKIDTNARLFKIGWLTNNDLRYKQYIRGLIQFSENSKKYNYDTYLVDNSLPEEQLTQELKNIFKKYNIKYLYCPPDGYSYGSDNKGAGILQTWKQITTLLKHYQYIIHFEPRQFMHSNNLLPRFHKNKGNYIKRWSSGMETGFFVIESKALLNYINISSPSLMVRNHISLEKDLYKVLIRHGTKFNTIPTLGLYWYASKRNPNNPLSL